MFAIFLTYYHSLRIPGQTPREAAVDWCKAWTLPQVTQPIECSLGLGNKWDYFGLQNFSTPILIASYWFQIMSHEVSLQDCTPLGRTLCSMTPCLRSYLLHRGSQLLECPRLHSHITHQEVSHTSSRPCRSMSAMQGRAYSPYVRKHFVCACSPGLRLHPQTCARCHA